MSVQPDYRKKEKKDHCGHYETNLLKTCLHVFLFVYSTDHRANSSGYPSSSPAELTSGELAFGRNEHISCVQYYTKKYKWQVELSMWLTQSMQCMMGRLGLILPSIQ